MTRLKERIENFNRAFNIFSNIINEYKSDKNKVTFHMAAVQSFEVCFELGWKVLKDYLNTNGINVQLPKQVIKEAFNKEVIPNGQIWIDMLKDRNAIMYEYDTDKIVNILKKVVTIYMQELFRLKEQINAICKTKTYIIL